MARLWSSGFELQSVTSAVEWDTTTLSPTISTTTVRSGAASLRCNTTTARAFIRHQFTASSSAMFYARFYIYIVNYPSSIGGGNPDIAIASFGPANDYSSVLALSTTGTLILSDYDGANTITSSVLSQNQWHCIEMSHQDTGGNYELKVDGTSIGTDTGVNLVAITTFYVGMGANGFATETATGEFFIDDIAINNTSGTSQTSWPGEGKIVHLHPNEAGDAAATAGLYSAIDEVTPNDATDYIEIDTDSGGQQANYGFEPYTTPGIGASDSINLVQIGVRHRAETAASASYTPQIKSQASGTTVSGTATTHNDVTWRTNGDAAPRNYKLTSYVDPQAGGAWTPALLSTMIAGVNVTDGAPDLWISTIWALVEYVPTSSAPTVALNSPSDAATGVSVTPALNFTGTDAESYELEYQVQVDAANTFDSALATPTVQDSYSEATRDATTALDGTSRSAVGQSFKASFSGTLTSVQFFLIKTNSPTANATAKIYAHSGTFGSSSLPTGAALATSNNFDTSTLTGSYALTSFTFSGANQISLTATTNYVVTIEVPDLGATNSISVGRDGSSPAHQGNWCDLQSSTWASATTVDNVFYVYASAPTASINALSTTDAGFLDSPDAGDTHPFTSATAVQYTVQSALTNSTTYYWRVRAIDPTGSNTYGAWAATRSFETVASGGGTVVKDMMGMGFIPYAR